MEIIPVIDLKGGQVVHARLGRRDEYRAIETPLSATSDPIDVARGLLSLYPFAHLYVADLDAIESKGENDEQIARLKDAFPGIMLWVDNGAVELDAAREWLNRGWGSLVIGSESQPDLKMLLALAPARLRVLSLDFRGEAFQGPADLLANPDLWPQRVIAMTLSRVGSGAGPDIDRLTKLRAMAPDRDLYAAGGVRDIKDLENLARIGIVGALVATALHDGRLTSSDIQRAQTL